MPRTVNRLSHRTVQTLKEPGLYADGGGLYLRVDASGAKRWFVFFRWRGARKEMGLGGVGNVGLARARELATAAREQAQAGVNPIEARRAPAERPDFGAFADAFVDEQRAGWKSDKTYAQWTLAVTTYAAALRDKALDDITTEDVLAVLKPPWMEKPETARRLQNRLEAILDAATARRLRSGDNPARWKGHLKMLLPKQPTLIRGHHAALPYKDIGAFMAALRAKRAISARALEFAILTCARTTEVREIPWAGEIADALWTVPKERMKGGVEHVVPLCARVVEIVEEMRQVEGAWLFPGERAGRPLSNGAMERMVDDLAPGFTVHGFRSTFRDWAGDCTSFPESVAEGCLAHAVRDKTEAAYRRATALDKRRKMLEAWAGFCHRSGGGSVVELRRPA